MGRGEPGGDPSTPNDNFKAILNRMKKGGPMASLFFWFELFIKICQNTPQLCWRDEWLPSPLEGEGQGEGGIISSSPPL
jgi:hypothetical protein